MPFQQHEGGIHVVKAGKDGVRVTEVRFLAPIWPRATPPVTASGPCPSYDAAVAGSAEGLRPATSHSGRARSETGSPDRNEAWQNVRACEPQ
jgi:hypothetical protein